MVAVREISQRADAALVSAPVVRHVIVFMLFLFVSNSRIWTVYQLVLCHFVFLISYQPYCTKLSFVSGDDLTCPDGQNLVSSLPDFADFSLSNNMNQNTVS